MRISRSEITNTATMSVLMAATLYCLLTATEGQHLVISPRQTQIKTSGSGVIFTCTLTEYDTSLTPTMNWQSPQQADISSTRGRVYTELTDVNNLRLYVTNIEEADAGQYTCYARLATPSGDSENKTQSHNLSAEVKLFLYEEIQFAETPTLERNVLGSSALLQCVAIGQPKPEVSWRFKRQRVIPGNGKYSLEDNGLRINQLDLRDSGAYECRAEVESHGNVKIRSVNLDVLYPPVIMKNPTADLVVQGRNFTLQCQADGNPPVFYEWFREQKMSEMIRVKVRVAEGSDTYVIKDVDSEDEGRYFCRVTNPLGTKEVHVDIRMLILPKIKPSFPSRILLTEGGTLNISCEASGIPIPKIFWGRPGTREDYNKDAELAQLARSGQLVTHSHPGLTTLVIRNISRTLLGSLSCTAQSVVGLESKDTVFVVEYKPGVSIIDAEQLAWFGQTRNITCTADGVPSPTITWFHNQQYVIHNDTYSVAVIKSSDSTTSTLTVSVDDEEKWVYGKYTCMAKNVIGFTNGTANLVAAALPDAPRNVSVVDEQMTSVTLSAVAPVNDGGMPVTSWRVQYEPSTVSDHDQIMANRHNTLTFSDEDKMVISDLRPDMTYTFYLAAGNAVGYGSRVKFRVSTRSTANSAKRIDEEGIDADDGIPRTGETVVIEKKSVDVEEGGVLFTDGPIMVIALGTGSAVVLIACVLAVMCTFSAARRRKHRKLQGQLRTKSKRFDDAEFVGIIDSKPPIDGRALPVTGIVAARHQRCSEHGDTETCIMCRNDVAPVAHSTSINSCASKTSAGSQRLIRIDDASKIVSRPILETSVDGRWNASAASAVGDVVIGGDGGYPDPECGQLVELFGCTSPSVTGIHSRQPAIENHYCSFDEKLSNTVPKAPMSKQAGVVHGWSGSLSRAGPLPKIPQPPSLIGVATSSAATVSNVDLLPLRPFLLPVGFDYRYDVDPLANAAAINGYLSGENVDDDIDQEDFTIRMPSIDEKMCEYVSPSALAVGWTTVTSNRELMQRV